MISSAITYLKDAFESILFPKVCVICGMSLTGYQSFICGDCAEHRFSYAQLSKEDKINLPEVVENRIALWQFDKGGYLQDLLHKLKYKRLTGIGEDLGKILAQRIIQERFLSNVDSEKLLILPVPLHQKKKRTRGYNQAFYIAKGLASVLNIEVIEPNVVVRVKHTKTQTGFSLAKRRENISGAFKLLNTDEITGKNIIIVDDVFTTGATAFELANELNKAEVESVYIATIAQA